MKIVMQTVWNVGRSETFLLLVINGGSPVFTQMFQVKTQIFQVVPQNFFILSQNDQKGKSINFFIVLAQIFQVVPQIVFF
jgi:hypothetical protein